MEEDKQESCLRNYKSQQNNRDKNDNRHNRNMSRLNNDL